MIAAFAFNSPLIAYCQLLACMLYIGIIILLILLFNSEYATF